MAATTWFKDFDTHDKVLETSLKNVNTRVCFMLAAEPEFFVAEFREVMDKYPICFIAPKDFCFALCEFARDGKDQKDTCRHLGCIEIVLGIVERFVPTWLDEHLGKTLRVEYACTVQMAFAALASMTCDNKDNQQACLAKNGACILFRAMETFRNGPAAFVTPVCLALNNIVQDPSCKAICKEFDQLVTDLIVKFKDGPTIVVAKLVKLLYFMRSQHAHQVLG